MKFSLCLLRPGGNQKKTESKRNQLQVCLPITFIVHWNFPNYISVSNRLFTFFAWFDYIANSSMLTKSMLTIVAYIL